jgi:ABC-2 type transport system permease protein
MSDLYWLVRREFWENRAIWIVPVVIGAALTLAALFGRVDLGDLTTAEANRAVGGAALFAFGITFFLVMGIYSSWYLLDCLYADRKDRSVLFWKSMPISDTMTVLAKLFTGLIAIPLVYFVAADLATLLVAFIISVRARSTFGGALWQPDLWLQMQALWLYLIATTALWYLPVSGWLIAVSAWAKRAVILWSTLPILALYLLERWFFGTHRVGTMLRDRMFGYPAAALRDVADRSDWVTAAVGDDTITTPASVWKVLDPLGFLSSPATWIGMLVGIGLVAAAIQLRVRRTEM